MLARALGEQVQHLRAGVGDPVHGRLAIGESQDLDSLEQARAHLASNAPGIPCRLERGDAFAWLREARDEGRSFDLLVVDPPPLARRRGDVPRATRAYKDLLMNALRCARPGALLLGFAEGQTSLPGPMVLTAAAAPTAFALATDAVLRLTVGGDLTGVLLPAGLTAGDH